MSVVRTDVLQFVLMFMGFGYMAWHLIANYGGYGFLSSHLDPDMLSFPGNLSWSFIFVWGFIAFITFVDPSFYQRVFSGRSTSEVKRGIYISIALWFVFDAMTIGIGLYSAAIVPDTVFSPYIDLADRVLPPLARGVFIVSILSIISLMIVLLFAGLTVSQNWARGPITSSHV